MWLAGLVKYFTAVLALRIHLDTSNAGGSGLVDDLGSNRRVELDVSVGHPKSQSADTYEEGHEVVDLAIDGLELLLVLESL